jgi:hypothetical protein
MDELTQDTGSTPEATAAEAPGQHATRARRGRRQQAAEETAADVVGPADKEALDRARVVHPAPETLTTPPELREPGDDGDQEAPSRAAAVGRKKYVPPADPFGFEKINASENSVSLLKSEGEGAWVIRFAKNPNDTDGHSKEDPHPVLKMLKDEGYRWGFDGGDSKGGWGKAWQGDAYGQDHMEARRVLKAAAEMIGAGKQEAEQLAF